MSKTTYLLLFFAFSYISNIWYKKARIEMDVKQNGSTEIVETIRYAKCGKSTSSVLVQFKGKEYDLEIGKLDCMNGRYFLGRKVEVKYSKGHDKIVLPDAASEINYWMSVAFFLVPLFCLLKAILPFNYSIKKRTNKGRVPSKR